MTEKQKRKVTDYAGIAALVTAIGGLITLLLNQSHAEEKSALVQDSVLVVVQYRLEELEDQADDIEEELLALRFELSRRPGSRIAPRVPEFAPEPAPEVVEDKPVAATKPRPEATLQSVVASVKARKPVTGKALRQIVQQMGRPLGAEDLEVAE